MPTDAQTLVNTIAAQGYNKLSKRELYEALLAAIAQGGGGGCVSQSGAGSPLGAVTPAFIGQLYHDTTADTYYRSTGLTSADWTLIGGSFVAGNYYGFAAGTDPFWGVVNFVGNILLAQDYAAIEFTVLKTINGNFEPSRPTLIVCDCPSLVSISGHIDGTGGTLLTTLNLPSLVSIGDYLDFNNCTLLSSLNLNALQTVVAQFNVVGTALTVLDLPNLQTVGDFLDGYSMNSLTTINLPSLTSVGTDFDFDTDPLLTTINAPMLASVGTLFINNDVSLISASFPSLITVSGQFATNGSTSLSNLSVPNWVPTDGTTINCSNCALNATSVELVLRRCVLAGVTTCTITLTGGTNAGLASLSVQGQADAAALGAQLTINP